MMRFTLPILIAALLLLSACSSDAMTQEQIKQEIAAANYCETPDDCVDVGGKCPFDCYIFVNGSEADRIKTMVDGHGTTCTYSCLAINGVDCVNNKCQPVHDMPAAVPDEITDGNIGASCTSDDQCITPLDYLIRSSCPFGAKCVDGACSVVCQMIGRQPDPSVSQFVPMSCGEDSDCDCGTYAGSDQFDCRCVDNACYAVIND